MFEANTTEFAQRGDDGTPLHMQSYHLYQTTRAQSTLEEDEAYAESHRYQLEQRMDEYIIGPACKDDAAQESQLQSRPVETTRWGNPEYFPNKNSPSADHFRSANSQLNSSEGDLAFFWHSWNSPFRKDIIKGVDFVLQPENWAVLRYDMERPLELFLSIAQLKIAKTPLLDKIYPGLLELLQRMARRVEVVEGEAGRVRTEERQSAMLFEHFLDEVESMFRQEGAFFMRVENPNGIEKIPIRDYIAKTPVFRSSYPWQELFNVAHIFKEWNLYKPSLQDEIMEAERKRTLAHKAALSAKVKEVDQATSPLPADNRPCCAQFFCFGYSVADLLVPLTPVLCGRKLAELWRSGAGEGPGELRAAMLDVCALLNSGGGVLLFDTFRTYLYLRPQGCQLHQEQLAYTRALLDAELRNFHPPVALDREITLSFVPVAHNPRTHGVPASGRTFIDGLFVMRLVVRPSSHAPERIYFFGTDENAPMQVAVVRDGAAHLLRGSNLTKQIKRRFNYHYIPEADYADEEELAMLRRSCSYFDNHTECLSPMEGRPAVRVKAAERGTELEQRYRHLTLLVAAPANHQAVQERLRAKGIDCEVVAKYQNYNFRAAKNSAALYHNCRFDQLLSEVAYKKEFEFAGRYILTIHVTPFIKLVDRNRNNLFPEEDFLALEGWMRQEHPDEKLALLRVEEGEEWEFYMQTNSKTSTLFMYYVLTTFGEKSSFKNPKNYDRMSQQDRKNKMQPYYPRTTPAPAPTYPNVPPTPTQSAIAAIARPP